jgi:RNA-directed DNA polymerase
MMKFLEHRIGDPRILRLIRRMLKGGIMEDGLVRASERGTPQGSILSPLLSNIYLHYVLDLWFSHRVRRQCRGEAYYFRFADDFLACFRYKADAKHFENRLKDRLEAFSLEIAKEKTHCIEFGRFARRDAQRRGSKAKGVHLPGVYALLWENPGWTLQGEARTSRKKLAQSLRKFTEWARKSRAVLRKGEMLRQAKVRVVGHLSYYAITDNSDRCAPISIM